MNIVFIIDRCLPKPTSNSVCIMNVAQSLVKAGHKVKLITQQFDDPIHSFEGIDIVYVPKLIDNPGNVIIHTMKFLLNKSYYNVELAKNYYNKVLELNNEEKIDKVICVQHPVESLRVGLMLKKNMPNLNVIAYFLDPIEGFMINMNMRKKILRHNARGIYKQVIKAYDGVIMPEYWNGEYMSTMGIDPHKVISVGLPNLQEEQIVSAGNHDDINVVFAGNFYNDIRGIEFLEKVKGLFSVLPNLKIHLYSRGLEDKIEKYTREYKDNIFSHGFVDKDILDDALKGADYLLNISNRVRCSVPGKIFEYFSYAKPIINYQYIENDPTTEYIKQYPVNYNIKDSEALDIEAFKKFIVEHRQDKISYEDIKKIYATSLPSYSAELIVK